MQKTPGTPRLRFASVVAVGALALAGCGGDDTDTSPATVELNDSENDRLGQVEFMEVDAGLELNVEIDNLAPGFYGFHVHEIGECEPESQAPDDPENTGDFMSAGSHIGADNEELDHPEHDGDLPTLLVNEDGTAKMSVVTDRLDASQLMDLDGAAMMIHSDPDNFANIPDRYLGDETSPDEQTLSTGDAGERIGCGVVEGVVEE